MERWVIWSSRSESKEKFVYHLRINPSYPPRKAKGEVKNKKYISTNWRANESDVVCKYWRCVKAICTAVPGPEDKRVPNICSHKGNIPPLHPIWFPLMRSRHEQAMKPKEHMFLSCAGLMSHLDASSLQKVVTKRYFTFHSTNDRRKVWKHHYIKDKKQTKVNNNNNTLAAFASFA